MNYLGFIVEGDTDAIIIRALVERMMPRGTKFAFVRAGGKIGIYSSSPTAMILQDKGYDHVFVLFDADTNDSDSIQAEEAHLADMFAKRGVNHGISVCPVVPTIEGWVLAGMSDQPANALDPKAKFAQVTKGIHGSNDLRRIVRKLDLRLMERRNASFASFARQLEQACASASAH